MEPERAADEVAVAGEEEDCDVPVLTADVPSISATVTHMQAPAKEVIDTKDLHGEAVVDGKPAADAVIAKFASLRRYKIAKDGNCVFRTGAHQLFGDQSRHPEVRNNIVKFMERNSMIFGHSVDGQWHQYLENQAKDSVWGGALELRALGGCYNVAITVFRCDAKMKVTTHHTLKWNEAPVEQSEREAQATQMLYFM